MKTIVAGSRSITNYDIVKQAIEESKFTITEVVSGNANGVDKLGERWAKENNIPCKQFKPDWNKHGKAAGILRNVEMADYAGKDGQLVLIWDGSSRGSAHMRRTATLRNIKIHERIVNQ